MYIVSDVWTLWLHRGRDPQVDNQCSRAYDHSSSYYFAKFILKKHEFLSIDQVLSLIGKLFVTPKVIVSILCHWGYAVKPGKVVAHMLHSWVELLIVFSLLGSIHSTFRYYDSLLRGDLQDSPSITLPTSVSSEYDVPKIISSFNFLINTQEKKQ